AACEYLGQRKVKNVAMRMSSEDFAYYSKICPTTFYRLGCGNKKKNIISPLHSPNFSIDEDCIKIGMGLMVWLTINLTQVAILKTG
ncbi:MAG: amidohydrolase, partial [Bacteroidia bacterium]|nr:amidohydrolase [Bacteroidia bacterium]